MLSVSDYYKHIQPTFANAKDIDMSLLGKLFFPQDGVYIGDYESATGDMAPALLPLAEVSNICFLTTRENRSIINNLLQKIALRLALAINPHLCKFTLYDGTGLGANLIALSNISSKIKGENILTEPDELKRALSAAKMEIPNTIQKVLGHKYLGKTLIEYNEAAGEMAKPYHFIFITDFPHSLSNEHCQLLENIIKSGRQAGVFVFLSLDTTYVSNTPQNSYQKEYDPMQLLDLMTVIYPVEDRYYIKNIPGQDLVSRLSLHIDNSFPSDDMLEEMQEKIENSLRESVRSEVSLADILTPHKLWTRTASNGVEIPIGKVNISELQNFTLSVEDGVSDSPHHCLIGGSTGSGKTVLLHNVICNAAWLYSPDELQFVLLDYKEGTEFKVYEDLPHVKILGIRSEREFGKSVFDYLTQEMTRRGEEFKKLNVANIARYNAKSEKKLPRILVVIDEFQKLLDGDARTSMYMAAAIDNIGRLGRSFGINLILSTQSLRGIDTQGCLSQFGLHIALKLNSADECDTILGSGNIAPYTILTKKGEAIYNARGGLSEGNVRFQTAYIGDAKLVNMISQIREKVLEQYGTEEPYHRFVYDGSVIALIENNELLKHAPEINEKICNVYIGEPVGLNEKPISYTLRRQNESNVLIIGQDYASATSILKNTIIQVQRQSSSDAHIYVCDKTNVDSEYYGKLEEVASEFKNVTFSQEDKEIVERIKEVHAELKRRIENNVSGSRIILAFSNLYDARILRKVDYNYSDGSKMLTEILRDGPTWGIHVIVYTKTYAHFCSVLDGTRVLPEFGTRIELKGGDGHSIMPGVDSEKRSPNREYVANIFKTDQEEPEKVKVYQL